MLEIFEKFNHPLTKLQEIKSGVLWDIDGGCYPIVNGIPRMLPESFLAYFKELTIWWPTFSIQKVKVLKLFGETIASSAKKNKKIQDSFGFEWDLLRRKNGLKIWDLNVEEFEIQLKKELQLNLSEHFEMALDAGCGHGRSARLLTQFSDIVFGAEVSQAVELAYEQNDNAYCHFVQADVHFLPFPKDNFNLIYSSGVLHHNPSTKKALQKVLVHLKEKGILSIWLYHPYKNAIHIAMRTLRSITIKIPVKTVYYFNKFTLTPLQYFISQIRGKKKKFLEISIEQLDMLTPAYRHEHSFTEVENWLKEEQFAKIEMTDNDNFGFSVKAIKM